MEVPDPFTGGARVSVVVLTFMEEANIETCLRSVAGWSTDIHVLDSGSTDRTIEIARKLAHHVHSHRYLDHRSQIEYVLTKLPLMHEWLLILDADHEVSRELKNSIDSMLAAQTPDVDLFYFPQKYVFRGQPIRSLSKWGRLIKHRNVEVESGELVDARYLPKGSTAFLRGEVIEHNLNEDDIDFWIDKHQRYASRAAIEELLRRAQKVTWAIHPRLFGNPDQQKVWLKTRWYSLPLFVRPFLFFAYRYVWKLGFLEGRTGFLFHFLQGFWFRLLIDIKLSDLERRVASREVEIEDLLQAYGQVVGIGHVAVRRTHQEHEPHSKTIKRDP